ncbi:MAG: hypothetical protein H6575_13800 [Lewinellaceae bacterium]|nr:hypothetical protein [Lewinellaceae bacterium]
MTQREKTDAILFGVLLGFLLFFGLLEQQKQQTSRLREMRKRLAAENGEDIDIENLRNDWQKIRGDLRNASEKALQNVQ